MEKKKSNALTKMTKSQLMDIIFRKDEIKVKDNETIKELNNVINTIKNELNEKNNIIEHQETALQKLDAANRKNKTRIEEFEAYNKSIIEHYNNLNKANKTILLLIGLNILFSLVIVFL